MKAILKAIVIRILQWESRLVIKKYKPKIVAITGSVGKTSTKDAIAGCIGEVATVRKSKKSYNSEIGLPLTILGCPNAWNNPFAWIENVLYGLSLVIFRRPFPEWLVLEVGIGKPGDMARTASWLKTDIVVTSVFGTTPVHVEFFDSKDGVSLEEFSLVGSLKNGGILIVNGDDPTIPMLLEKIPYHGRILRYGFGSDVDVRGANEQILYEKNETGWERPVGMSFRVEAGGNSIPIVVRGGVGAGHLSAPLAGFAVVTAMEMNAVKALKAFEKSEALFQGGRMRLIEGREGSTIIDDSYNASPIAMHAAVHVLSSIETKGRRIAVLGDMLELGRHTDEEHKKVGELVAKLGNIQILITVGPRAVMIAESAKEHGYPEDRIIMYREAHLAIEPLRDIIADADIILIKGSQGIRTERIVESIMAHPEDKERLLCRQDPEWIKRK